MSVNKMVYAFKLQKYFHQIKIKSNLITMIKN